MEAEHLEAALARAGDRRVVAVYPVHLNGQCAELNAIRELAEKHGLMVIEDACHALGASYRPADAGEAKIGAGAFADMAIFSFHPVKTIAMGEGGAVTTSDEALYRRLMRMRNHGMTRDAEAFTSADLAFDAEGAALHPRNSKGHTPVDARPILFAAIRQTYSSITDGTPIY